MRLLTASVGPFETRAACQAAISLRQWLSERGWVVGVLGVVPELGHPLECEVRIGVGPPGPPPKFHLSRTLLNAIY